MGSRRHIPPAYEGRPLPAGYRLVESHPPPEVLENKLAIQAAEMNRLAGDNHKLATNHVALRREFDATQQEIQKLKEHIKSTQSESDIQIRIFLGKIAKMEADIRAGGNVKTELQEAVTEARSLVAARDDLNSKIQQASQELEKSQADIKKLPEMLAEVEHLREEHQVLRKTFEVEKVSNTGKVEQMRIMEKDLVGMAREVERLRADVLNAERRANAPNLYNNGLYMNPDPSFPPHMPGTVGYVDRFNGPYAQLGVGAGVQGSVQYGSGGIGPGVGGNSAWQGAYGATHARR